MTVAGKIGRPRVQARENDPIVAVRLATRCLESQAAHAPAPLQYATVPARHDDRYRP